MKKKIASAVIFVLLLNMVMGSIIPVRIVTALGQVGFNLNLTLKVNGNDVDINKAVSLVPGNKVDFALSYNVTEDGVKPKEGDELVFSIPKSLGNIVPVYPNIHFKEMKQEGNTITLICGPEIQYAIKGNLNISATVKQVEVEEVEPFVININGKEVKLNMITSPSFSVNRLIDKQVSGSNNEYTIPSNSTGGIVGQEVPYSIAVNEKYTSMQNAVLTDKIPEGMELVPASIAVKKVVNGVETDVTNGTSIRNENGTLSIDFGDIHHKHIVRYKMRVTSLKEEYKNLATITSNTTDTVTDSVIAKPKPDIATGSTDIEKNITSTNPIEPDNNGSLIGKKVDYKVNVNRKKTIKNNTIFTDKIPTGMKLLPSTVKVIKEERGTIQDVTALLGDGITKTDTKLEIVFGDITTQYTVTYQTEIIEDKDNYANEAKLVWDGGSSQTSVSSTPNKPKPGSGAIDKKVDGPDDTGMKENTTFKRDADGNVVGKIFDYAILVNNEMTQKENLVLTDKLPKGMELDVNSVKVFKAISPTKWLEVTKSVSIDAAANQLKVQFGSTNDKYKVEYKTKITDFQTSYLNTADVKWGTANESKSDVSTVTPAKGTIGNTNIVKTIEGGTTGTAPNQIVSPNKNGTYTGMKIAYKVVVNDKFESKKDAVFKDTLPVGMKFSSKLIKIEKYSQYGSSDDVTNALSTNTIKNTSTLTINFGDITEKYVITYEGELTDFIQSGWENNVELTWGTNEKDSTKAIVKPKPATPGTGILSKVDNKNGAAIPNTEGSYIGNTFTYTVIINNELKEKENMKLEDILPPGMELLTTTVKLERDTGGKYEDITNKGIVTLNKDKAGLNIQFGTTSMRYRLTYTTEITSDESSYPNKVTLNWDGGSEEATSTVTPTKPVPGKEKLKKTIEVKNTYAPEGTEVVDGNFIGKEYNYKVLVNDTLEEKSNAVIADTLPPGMELVPNSIKVEIDRGAGVFGDVTNKPTTTLKTTPNSFTVDLGIIKDRYIITYKGKITNLVENGYENNVTFTYGNDVREISFSKLKLDLRSITPDDKDTVITKNASAKFVTNIGDKVKYTLKANEEKRRLQDVIITDTMPEGMKLILDGFIIKENGVDVTSAFKATNKIAMTDEQLIIDIGETYHTYEIQYTGEVTKLKAAYDNGVSVTGKGIKTRSVRNYVNYNVGADGISAVKEVDKTDIKESGNQQVTYTIKVWSTGVFPEKYLNIEDKLDERVKFISIDNDSCFDAKYDENTHRITITNIEDIAPATYQTAKKIKITVSFENVKSGEIVENIAKVNNTDNISAPTVKKGYKFTTTKVDGDNNNVPLQNAVFELYKVEQKSILGFIPYGQETLTYIKEVISDVNGVVSSSVEDTGTYVLREKTSPNGYDKLIDDVRFDMKETDMGTVLTLPIIKNYQTTSDIKVLKVDDIHQDMGLKDTEFSLFNSKGEFIVAQLTGDDGTTTFKNVKPGNYTVKETKAPPGYQNKEEVQAVKVELGEKKEYVIKYANKYNGQEIQVKKVDKDDNALLLSGASYTIKSANTIVGTIITDENGLAQIKLPIGEYTIEETKAPFGYAKSDKVTSFKVEVATSEVLKFAFTNEIIPGQVLIKKADKEDPTKLLKDATFEIQKESGEVVTKITTGENGLATATLRPGKYQLIEKEAPKGYVKLNESIPFEIEKEQQSPITLEMLNSRIKGTLEMTKTDVEDEKVLQNATFTIRNEKGEEVISGKTDEKGVATFQSLPYGKYTYEETKAPEGYVKDTNQYPFEIKEDGEIVKATMTNKKIKGTLEMTKTDVEDGKVLQNATFTIRNEKGEEVISGKTNEKGNITFQSLPYGKYTYEETKAPEGYVKDTKQYPFEIKENGEIVKATMTNKKIAIKPPVIKPGETVKPDDNSENNPDTGDDGVKMNIIILIMSLLILVGIGISRKRIKR